MNDWLSEDVRRQIERLNEGMRLLASGDREGYARWYEAQYGSPSDAGQSSGPPLDNQSNE